MAKIQEAIQAILKNTSEFNHVVRHSIETNIPQTTRAAKIFEDFQKLKKFMLKRKIIHKPSLY
jgi:hypothetical protein